MKRFCLKFIWRSILKVILVSSWLLVSCWSENSKPEFIKLINSQVALDSSLKTTIKITPKEVSLGRITQKEGVNGYFWVKNTGNIEFNIKSITSECDCCKINTENQNKIAAGDSIKINYSIDVSKETRSIRHAIIVVGNCQYGNQTFLLDAFIN